MYDDLLAAQWGVLRAWIDESGVLAGLGSPSSLPGWSVGELIAHLGMVPLALTRLRPADDDETALSVGEYVSAYAPAADEVAAITVGLASEWESDLLAGIDAAWTAGLDALGRISATIVSAPRGLIRRDDFVVTRLLELVAHSYDLAASLPDLPAPALDPAAVRAVATALGDEYKRRTGHRPDTADQEAWVRAASGRAVSDDPALPLL